ncbi:putative sensor histidine kinase TcrY [mine drainage metagenome]|uniref:histidine kinase n=1 Tax=mine drainage metagenome TaxID=410659 RepID=A0A1J5QQL0_9ZZZZ
MTRVRDRLHGVPLRLRFVAITTTLLLIGLAVVGATALTLLHRSLVQQVDDQLTSAAKEVVEQATRTAQGLTGDTSSGAPSDYYVQFETADGTPVQTVFNRTSTTSEQFPVIPSMTFSQVRNLNSPFTVRSVDGKSSWRVIAGTFTDGSGSVFVALPLHSANVTMAEMQMALIGISLGVVAIGGVTGYVAVRRSLRPLEEIESTAAAIADGDLGRRIPAAPESTEVGRLGVALNGMLTQIESAFDARTASEARMRRFVADASHELRTPLATIRGYGELFRMGALTEDEQLRDTMRRIEGSATRMGSLVEDLLALARMDEGRPMRSDHVDLAVLAGDAVGDLHALDRDRPVRLVPAQDGGSIGPTVVVGDEARLRQVLANLIGNVVQHTPPGTPVEIGLGLIDDENAVVEVRDHGPGISPEHAARVFERFYRVDASRTRDSGGAGLGMAIVEAIVTSHQGRVELLTTPGGGTTVRVTLPRTPRAPHPPVTGEQEVTSLEEIDVG